MPAGRPSSSCLISCLVTIGAGGVVRVADVDEPELARVLLRRVDDHADVLAIVAGQRQLDRLRLDVRGVLIDRAVRGLDAEHLLAAEKEGRADDLQHLARARREHDVLRLDAVVLRDRLNEFQDRDSHSGRHTSTRLPSTSSPSRGCPQLFSLLASLASASYCSGSLRAWRRSRPALPGGALGEDVRDLPPSRRSRALPPFRRRICGGKPRP